MVRFPFRIGNRRRSPSENAMTTRDEFTEKTKRIIASRVGYCCSYPDCNALTIGPTSDSEKFYNVGAACHISAAAPGGPRYDPSLETAQRRHPDNGIWMCRTHGDEIDDDTARFTIDLLAKWKAEAEARTLVSLGKTRPVDSAAIQFGLVSKAERFGIDARVGLTDGTELLFGKTYPADRSDLDIWGLTLLIMRFLVAKPGSAESILLSNISVHVYDFCPLPSDMERRMYAYPQTVFPYFINLSKPGPEGTVTCPCLRRFVPDTNQLVDFAPLVIDDDITQVIDVRLAAQESGIYDISIDATITSGIEKQSYRVFDRQRVVIETFD